MSEENDVTSSLSLSSSSTTGRCWSPTSRRLSIFSIFLLSMMITFRNMKTMNIYLPATRSSTITSSSSSQMNDLEYYFINPVVDTASSSLTSATAVALAAMDDNNNDTIIQDTNNGVQHDETKKMKQKKKKITKKKKATIGYAVTVTDCFLKDAPHIQYNESLYKQNLNNNNKATNQHYQNVKVHDVILDNAAIIQHSIYLSSLQSEYDYQLYAFIHYDAKHCGPYFSKLGYTVQLRHNPVNKTTMKNLQLAKATKNGCCGEKEFMKLYSYLLLDHPIVVHLDLDTIVLKPLDPLFNLMLFETTKKEEEDDENSSSSSSSSIITQKLQRDVSAMWIHPDWNMTTTTTTTTNDNNNMYQTTFPDQIDFFFTRDYNMVDPPRRQPHQIGVQGGFLVIRPNVTDYQRYVDIIIDGANYTIGDGWGGPKLAFGGYYGAATVQGLTSYYFSHLESNRAVELNRCYYNTMVDDPMDTSQALAKQRPKRCRTLETQCQDCRDTKLTDIYTAHFTVCGKIHWCINPVQWSYPNLTNQHRLCIDLFHEWHKVRSSLEDLWIGKYDDYEPPTAGEMYPRDKQYRHSMNYSMGHCSTHGQNGYIKMDFPDIFYDLSIQDPI